MLQRRNAPSVDSSAPAQGASPELGAASSDLGSNAAARETLVASAGSGLNDQALKAASDAAVAKAPSEMREGARGVIPVILRQAATSNIRNVNQVAYLLATAEHESSFGLRRYSRSQSFVEDRNPFSQSENGAWSARNHVTGQNVSASSQDALETRYWDNAYGGMLGNAEGTRDARDFRGRGLVQITGRSNYQKMGAQLQKEGFSYTQDGVTYGGKGNPPIDLVKNFEHVNKNVELASRLMISGVMEGSYTGRKLGDYVNNQQTDFVNARRTVNGDTAKNGRHIADIAEDYKKGIGNLWAPVFTGPGAPVVNQPSRPSLTLTRVLQRGDKGQDVLEVQKLLGMSGGGLSGELGETTEKNIIAFQLAHKIQPTGKVGPTTLKVLLEKAGSWSPPAATPTTQAPAPQAPAPQAPAPQAPAPQAPAPQAPAGKTVTVRAGDTLSSIAGRALGDESRWREVYDLNRDQLKSPDQIDVGMVLKLPSGGAASVSHTVRAGDTLSDLAARYLGDPGRWQELYSANRDQLSSPDALDVGMVLKIPGAKGASTPAPAPVKPTPTPAPAPVKPTPTPAPAPVKPTPAPVKPTPAPTTPEASKQTLDQAIAAGKIFKRGDKGPAVAELQKLLGLGAGGQTGEFGATTEEAVKEFQAANRIQVNGMVGPQTLAALRSPKQESKAPIIDQHRMNHEYKGAFCGIATLLITIEGMGKDHGIDINNRAQLERFSEGIYTPGQGSSGVQMAARMREFGMKNASFTTGGSISTIMSSLVAGKPVPVGVVSMGGEVVDNPRASARYGKLDKGDRHFKQFGASGHWVTVVGFEGDPKNPTHFLVNDPDTGAQLRLTRAELERHSAAHEGIWMIPH